MNRPLKLTDVEAVFKLEQRIFVEPWTRKEIRRHLDGGLGTVEIVRGKIAAYALYGQCRNHFILARIAVHPDKQRSGIGRELLKLICRDRRMVTFVPDDETEVQLFFRACGLKCTRIKYEWFANGRDAYVFRNMTKRAKRTESAL